MTEKSIDALIGRMTGQLAALEASGDARRYFHATYLRTTVAVRDALRRGVFLDADWVERWDVVFAELYLDALDLWDAERTAPEPWTVAFTAAAEGGLPPLRHVLLGMNAHINLDLPQACIACITDEEFADEALLARRSLDHQRIDGVLIDRVRQEDRELMKVERPGDRTLLDRALIPFNRLSTKRFLVEARRKVWRNAGLLSDARRRGHLDVRLAELESAVRDRVAELRAPGQVVLRLARDGFGVELVDHGAASTP